MHPSLPLFLFCPSSFPLSHLCFSPHCWWIVYKSGSDSCSSCRVDHRLILTHSEDITVLLADAPLWKTFGWKHCKQQVTLDHNSPVSLVRASALFSSWISQTDACCLFSCSELCRDLSGKISELLNAGPPERCVLCCSRVYFLDVWISSVRAHLFISKG